MESHSIYKRMLCVNNSGTRTALVFSSGDIVLIDPKVAALCVLVERAIGLKTAQDENRINAEEGRRAFPVR